MRRSSVVVVVGLVLTACSASRGGPSDASAKAGEGTCAAEKIGLGSAKHLLPWKLPAGCTANVANGAAPKIVRTEADFKALFTCPPDARVDLDFASHEVVVASRTLSPAGVGTDLYDDGKTVTFVNRQRAPCPNDPRPMPIGFTIAFLLPPGGERTFAEASCTVESKCP